MKAGDQRRSARTRQPRTHAAFDDRIAYPMIASVGAVLWWACATYPATLPPLAPWDFSWLWYLATALALWWYARGLALTPAGDRPSNRRTWLFLAGIAVLYVVLQTRFDYVAQHMFFVNRIQHIVMHHLGPFLIALAWPGATLLRGMPAPLRRIATWRPVLAGVRILQQPLIAATLFVGLVALWLIPDIHFWAMIDPTLYAVMNWSMVVDGILFWSLVLDPRPNPPALLSFPGRGVLAAVVLPPQVIIGAVITFAPDDLYAFYTWCGRYFPTIGPMTDQLLGGLIVWTPAVMMSIAAVTVVFFRMLVPEGQSWALQVPALPERGA
jgi:putative membrane protein